MPEAVRAKSSTPVLFHAQADGEGACCYTLWTATPLGMLLPFPCFWPHLIIFCLGPASCCCALQSAAAVSNTWVLVNETEVVVTQAEFFGPCPCCFCASMQTNYVPLEVVVGARIIDEVNSFQACCLKLCGAKKLPRLAVDTTRGRRLGKGRFTPTEVEIVGIADKTFAERIMRQRDAGRQHHNANDLPMAQGVVLASAAPQPQATAAVYPATMAHQTAQPSVEDRLTHLADLKEKGFINQAEYDERRAAILASI